VARGLRLERLRDEVHDVAEFDELLRARYQCSA
jgi:hypothetical protein